MKFSVEPKETAPIFFVRNLRGAVDKKFFDARRSTRYCKVSARNIVNRPTEPAEIICRFFCCRNVRVAEKSDVFVARDENPMDILGLGANMVKSLRWWLQVVGLTTESQVGRRLQTLTPLGAQIFEHDKYIEERGTLFLLQESPPHAGERCLLKFSATLTGKSAFVLNTFFKSRKELCTHGD